LVNSGRYIFVDKAICISPEGVSPHNLQIPEDKNGTKAVNEGSFGVKRS
jgi:hypothetical protein